MIKHTIAPSMRMAALTGTTAKVQIITERSNSGTNPKRKRSGPVQAVRMSAVRLQNNHIVKGLKARPSVNFKIV